MLDNDRIQFIFKNSLKFLIAVFSLILFILLLLFLADANFNESLKAFSKSAFGGRKNAYLFSTVSRCALIMGMALSALIAFRAGIINIGGEGQLVVGGFVAAIIAVNVQLSGMIGIIIIICSAVLAGSAWAIIAGWLQLSLGVPILVGSLLLNYPARYICSYFVNHPFRDVASGMPQTHLIDKSLWLPYVDGTRLDFGFSFILAAYLLTLIYSHYSVAGYKAKMVGMSQEFAATSGISVPKVCIKTLIISGGIAGLVGAIAVLGIHHRFTDGMLVQPLYAWTGIVAALLVNLIPWAILPAAFFFAALTNGAAGMERIANVPKEIAIIIQGIIILYVSSGGSNMSKENSEEP